MREIKFRAGDENNKVMINWEEIQEQWESEGYSDNILRGDHYVPMQYTGVNDMKDVNVYEDDILEIWIDNIKQDGYYLVEDLRELNLEMNRDDSYYRISKIKVVGNKWENPELL